MTYMLIRLTLSTCPSPTLVVFGIIYDMSPHDHRIKFLIETRSGVELGFMRYLRIVLYLMSIKLIFSQLSKYMTRKLLATVNSLLCSKFY